MRWLCLALVFAFALACCLCLAAEQIGWAVASLVAAIALAHVFNKKRLLPE